MEEAPYFNVLRLERMWAYGTYVLMFQFSNSFQRLCRV